MWLLSGVWSLLNQNEPKKWCLEVTYDMFHLMELRHGIPHFVVVDVQVCSDIIDYICMDASCELQDPYVLNNNLRIILDLHFMDMGSFNIRLLQSCNTLTVPVYFCILEWRTKREDDLF